MSNEPCGCCEGLEPVTPLIIFNRPGLKALRRRVGEYSDFYETLLSRITTQWVDVEINQAGPHGEMLVERLFPLRNLRTRASDDLTIALLDAWSLSADVLTFYSERIANEGYLRTALELRSLIGLSNLVGYRRRPGVASSVFLAFTADSAAVNASGLTVPAGAQVQSVPDPGQLPQTFETSDPLVTHPAWNVLTPRQTRPTYLLHHNARTVSTLYVQGTKTSLSANSPLLLAFNEPPEPVLRWVTHITEDFTLDRTAIELSGGVKPKLREHKSVALDQLLSKLSQPASVPPASPDRLNLTPSAAFQRASATADMLLASFYPKAAHLLPQARANATVTRPPTLTHILAPRVKASVYAYNAPRLFTIGRDGNVIQSSDWNLDGTIPQSTPEIIERTTNAAAAGETWRIIDLDTIYDTIQPGTWVVILRPNKGDLDPLRQTIAMIKEVQTVSRSDFNFPAKVTRLTLDRNWLDDKDIGLMDIRSTTVYAAPEELTIVDEPVAGPVCGQEIELNQLVDGLQPGRWLIITGERTDLPVEGIQGSELVMLNQTRQDTLYIWEGKPVSAGQLPELLNPHGKLPPDELKRLEMKILKHPLPGDLTHTFLTLAAGLSYCYKRHTVKIYANVSHATHGETRSEALGSGDGSKTFQTFDLKGTPPPLTYTAAIATDGVESSLKTFVNNVRWHEAENILDLGPATRGFLTSTDDQEKTSIMFGDGINGARLPSAGTPGQENVRAIYRRGIGSPGNVREGTITRLLANVDGMTAVVNPRPATGGADPDGSGDTRKRAPLAVSALDRLVGVEDYADFSRLFAGIAKASAARLATRYGHVMHVTIAGVDDIPIDQTSDLYLALLGSLKRFGDPYLPVQLERRSLSLLVISAKIRIDPDYIWEDVKANLRSALLDTFGFDSRELGQDAYTAEAVAAMQAVPGVLYVDLDLFGAVPETLSIADLNNLSNFLQQNPAQGNERIPAALDRIDPQNHAPAPAGLVILSPDIPSTLLLSEVPNE